VPADVRADLAVEFAAERQGRVDTGCRCRKSSPTGRVLAHRRR